MKKDNFVYVEDILDAFGKIFNYIQGSSEQDFYKDEKTQDAVIRKFEIAGEAVKNISQELKDQYPGVPWKSMAGMRDKLIHDYAGVDLVAVWETIQKLLPSLISDFNKIYAYDFLPACCL